jgi:hypothetical protein
MELKRVESEAPPAEKPASAFASFDAKLAEESQFAVQIDAVGHVQVRNSTV